MNLQISRRTALRGLGAALSLPLLEAMHPRNVYGGRTPDAPPTRMAFLYVPNGMHMPDWTPATEGFDFELPPALESMADYRSDITMLSGLALDGGRSHGDGGGDHARSVASFLTGAHPKKTNGADIENGPSVDQAAAEKIGNKTRLPSLELGLERSAPAGRCDSGYSCVYTSNMSWRTPTSPVAKETDPGSVFDRLFGNQQAAETRRSRMLRDEYRKSILDFVLEDASALRRELGVNDKQKLDEYLFAVRQIERRINEADKLHGQEPDVPDYPRPAGSPSDFAEHCRLMFDLMTLAFETDSTRVITFMFTNAGSNRSYKQVGVSDGHHSLSHHGRNAEKQAKIAKVNRYHLEQFSYLAGKLKASQEQGQSLLKNCMVMYGSGIADGDRHNHEDLPIMLLGQGGGVKSGQHRRYQRDTPLTNLYVSMLQKMGVETDKFSDSTGSLDLS
ncbi:DUF1552 domain-containing protein [Lignipirellula cremea]|uniref:DUF1552 domain-containing protein n=1 Tax=Lignipirellula cremea TaxID=2528010 RepID=A0A518E1A4_9BACT|nr:DUF1552 domain-containing protein [Lignipirellula cremea]QDU97870.1 hypothetical protein Pla8534_57270 [Lignipirellula cremea]